MKCGSESVIQIIKYRFFKKINNNFKRKSVLKGNESGQGLLVVSMLIPGNHTAFAKHKSHLWLVIYLQPRTNIHLTSGL